MKYKVGDKVRIKSLDWYDDNKNGNDEVVISSLGPVFTHGHSKYADRVMTIGIVSKLGFYVLKEDKDGNRWYDEMFEGLAEEETEPKMVKLDDVCEWIEKHIFDFPWYDNEQDDFSSKDIANALRKAMEG